MNKSTNIIDVSRVKNQISLLLKGFCGMREGPDLIFMECLLV